VGDSPIHLLHPIIGDGRPLPAPQAGLLGPYRGEAAAYGYPDSFVKVYNRVPYKYIIVMNCNKFHLTFYSTGLRLTPVGRHG
jgi:hypothetical protein